MENTTQKLLLTCGTLLLSGCLCLSLVAVITALLLGFNLI